MKQIKPAASKRKKFTSLHGAQNTRVMVWICAECEMWQYKKHEKCPLCDGKLTYFASRKEAARYVILLKRQKMGIISDLKVHPKWPITINGIRIFSCAYDFCYLKTCRLPIGKGKKFIWVIEDVKASANKKSVDPVWKLKRAAFEAQTGMKIDIVTRIER